MEYKKIAVYGLGPQTRELLENREIGNAVVCLLDGYEDSGSRYGKPIVPLDALSGLGVEAVLVAAKPASQRVILRRIKGYCAAHRIAIVDGQGNDLTASNVSARPVFPDVCSMETAKKLIDAHDAVSFDLFDTLLTRRVPTPPDVFAVMEAKLRGTALAERLSFAEERLRAELLLSRDASPDLSAIYRQMQNRCGLSDAEAKTLEAMEWETDHALLLPRRDVCALLQYARERGKRVYVVSDTYYTAGQLATVLAGFGIAGVEAVYASCDRGMGKRNGLFSRFLKETGEKSVLHIGDDAEADVRAAKRAGLDALRLPSAFELFAAAGLEAALPEALAVGDRMKIGVLISELCNSPFAARDGRLYAGSAETLGAFFAPLAIDLALWLNRQVNEHGIDRLLLSARDGWLPKRLLDELDAAPRCVYFLTSRLSALFSCLKTPQDVLDAAKVPFQGGLQDMLRTRFLLDEAKCAMGSNDIQDYTEQILREADSRRRGYLRYLQSLNLSRGRIALFDLISAGTTQLAMQKLTGQTFFGFYLMKTEDGNPDKAALRQQSMLSADSEAGAALSAESFLLETILTAPEPSLLGFDDAGAPEYQREYRAAEGIAFVNDVQDAITAYFRQYRALAGTDESENPELDAAILKLLHRVTPASAVYRKMRWDDAYYHREIPVADLL